MIGRHSHEVLTCIALCSILIKKAYTKNLVNIISLIKKNGYLILIKKVPMKLDLTVLIIFQKFFNNF